MVGPVVVAKTVICDVKWSKEESWGETNVFEKSWTKIWRKPSFLTASLANPLQIICIILVLVKFSGLCENILKLWQYFESNLNLPRLTTPSQPNTTLVYVLCYNTVGLLSDSSIGHTLQDEYFRNIRHFRFLSCQFLQTMPNFTSVFFTNL